jgi:CubicO group peptidase (beta-lactamase class C family)
MAVLMEKTGEILKKGVTDGVFPGGSILVSEWGKIIYRAEAGFSNIFTGTRITPETVYDLASLTKPLATSFCLMKLFSDGRTNPDDRVGSILHGFDMKKKNIRIIDLLCHASGYPAHRPYYKILSEIPPDERKTRLKELLREEPFENIPGKRTVYSDLGFMLLRWIIEEVSGDTFENFFMNQVVKPLELKNTFLFSHDTGIVHGGRFAATEDCHYRKKIIQGETHDLNAFFSGGYDGHAGLFASIEDVNTLVKAFSGIYLGRNDSGFCDIKTARFFTEVPYGYERPPGFDKPSGEHPSAGHFFSASSIGHLGYTGTSFWLDPENGLCVILLTNRVHPSDLNISIRKFRPFIHDCVARAFHGLS